MRNYDSSNLTRYKSNKTIAHNFINKTDSTPYYSFTGKFDNSIVSNVAEGQIRNITKCQDKNDCCIKNKEIPVVPPLNKCPGTINKITASASNVFPSNILRISFLFVFINSSIKKTHCFFPNNVDQSIRLIRLYYSIYKILV